MEKAYDLKALGEMIVAEAKKEGLTLAENALEVLGKAAYVGSKNWAKESAVLSPNKMDDFVAPYYDALDAVVLPAIEGLDLDKDGK